MECQYCHKTFSGKQTLIKHQRTVKSCLEIQQSLGIEIKKLSYPCNVCKKEFTSNNFLYYHANVCSKNNIELQTKFDALKKDIQLIVDMPDKKLDFIIVVLNQNKGLLSSKKRKLFPELTDDEIMKMENAYKEVFNSTY